MAASALLDRFVDDIPAFEHKSQLPIDMQKVISVVLGGGEGTRLYPLTLTRSKPAINFGGHYRLIDIPISHSIHSGCGKIFVLTQFLSSSLHHHIFQTYLQGGKSASLIEILTAEQRPGNKDWFAGTADAVRQNLNYLLETPAEYFLILSGDQLYHIDFEEMVQFAQEKNADVVVATLPVTDKEAPRMGIMKVDSQNFITEFVEKPQSQALLQKLKAPKEILKSIDTPRFDPKRCYLGSMGIYLFKRKALVDLLNADTREDFGKHLIPTKVAQGNIAAYLYPGYWEDIGTIDSFYHANMSLLDPYPPFSLFEEQRPIFTSSAHLPPVKFFSGKLSQSILCEGAFIQAEEIHHSLIGPRSIIQKGTIIRDSYLMGNDYYHRDLPVPSALPPSPRIGENCLIQKAIIDKNVSIGNNVRLTNERQLSYHDGENVFIRDGIIVVARGATLPDGFTL